jgi:exodeoxyribonuclease V alpha subunit
MARAVVVLDRVYRYGGAIAKLATAVRLGDGEAAVAALRAGEPEVVWVPVNGEAEIAERELAPVRDAAADAGARMIAAARAGDAAAALAALGEFRLLCAHRRGAHGVSRWTERVQMWLSDAVADLDLEQRDYVGRPLLVTRNDAELGLHNGDAGVIVLDPAGGPTAAFDRGGELARVSPVRLGSVDTVHAMTIHKAQGSQFDTAAVVLPPSSRILTRELLYTAVTRARRRLIVVAAEAAVRAAVERPVARASGLRERLWGD